MKLTNTQNLPEPLVKAITWSDRNREGCVALVLGKRCGKCWRILPSASYYRLKNGRLYCYCKECHQEKNRLCAIKVPRDKVRAYQRTNMAKWRNVNRDKNRKQDRDRKALLFRSSRAYRDKVYARNKRHYYANRDRLLMENKQWRQTPRGAAMLRVLSARRKALIKSVTMPDADNAVRTIISKKYKLCFYCKCRLNKRNLHIEHKTPLSRGGKHEAANIVPSCAACNLRKGARTVEEFSLCK